MQRTFVILKPDALEQDLFRRIHDELAALGLKLGDWLVMQRMSEHLVRKHYARYADEPFFPDILAYMTRGPCAIAVWTGEDAVAKVRALVGATRPDQADPKSLRGRYGRVVDGRIENVIHAAATPEEAAAEIALFFDPHAG